MAEQNRKTAEQIRLREQAEAEVDAYIDCLQTSGSQDSIAREGRSLMGIFAEHGEIPRGSGFSGFCTLGNRVDKMRRYGITNRMTLAAIRMGQIDDDLVAALCIDRAYRGRVKVAVDPFTQGRVEIKWDDRRCADLLKISPDALRKRISRGYKALETVLQSECLAA